MIRIDAHQHFWELGRFDYSWLQAEPMRPIRRTFLPSDLEPLIKQAGVHKTVFVQTQHRTAENDWVLQLAEQHEFIVGVVGWVDLAGQACSEQLERYRRHPKFVGVRHVTQDEPDDDFIVRDDVLRGLKVLERHGLPFDLLFYPRHLRHAVRLATQLPGLPLVIDHLAKPQIRQRQSDEWEKDLRQAAGFQNVYCKLSGLVTEADWTGWEPNHLRPYVQTALEAFGPQRCMFGSDWPVCLLAASYSEVCGALAELTGRLSPDEQAWIWGRTAAAVYGLPCPPDATNTDT